MKFGMSLQHDPAENGESAIIYFDDNDRCCVVAGSKSFTTDLSLSQFVTRANVMKRQRDKHVEQVPQKT